MASSAYYGWVAAGRPYKLCRPAKALQAELRAHGLTVYDYPNDSHLKANPPEDHTPFSATGWPGKSAFGIGHAIDIMPRNDSAAARAENAAIARRLIADRNDGLPAVAWIKYLNWTDERGVCRQERWMPNHETRSSSDAGHIHVSARTDCDDDARADGYDPLEVNIMAEVYGLAGDPGDGRTTPTRVVDLWGGEQEIPPGGLKGYGTPTARTARLMRLEAKLDSVAKAIGVAQTDLDDIQAHMGGMTDTQVEVLAQRLGQVLVNRPDTPLTDADLPTLVKAFKQAVREGVGA